MFEMCKPMQRIAMLAVVFAAGTDAQTQPAQLKSMNLVAPTGKGRIVVPLSEDRKWQRVSLFPGAGPMLTVHDAASNLQILYMFQPNSTNSGKDCRDKIMESTERSWATGPSRADIKQERKTEGTNASGQPLSSGSFLIASTTTSKIPQEQLYGIVASREVCAEIRITKDGYTTTDDDAMQAALQQMKFEGDYSPVSPDYFLMGTLLFQMSKSYAAAATYYQRAVDTLTPDAPTSARRVMIDQLSTAYNLSGQAVRAVPVNEAAIKTDPDYPLYYYNLARADAEQGKAADAKAHLQQAFDRKAGVLPGEHLPDPTQDGSIQKLEKNKEFWAFVQTLK